MACMLETFPMFVQVFVGRWDGISRCFYGDKGNMPGSPEFSLGKVLTDKQNEKVSSLAKAIRPRFSHPFFFSLSPISSSSIAALPPLCLVPSLLLNSSLCYLYLCLQMPCLSSPIILHLPTFS